MGAKLVCFLLFVSSCYGAESPSTQVTIGIITTNDRESIYPKVLTENLDRYYYNATIQPVVLSDKETLISLNTFCSLVSQDKPLTAVINLEQNQFTSTIMSLSSHIGIPFIDADWTSKESKYFPGVISVYPEAFLLSQAYGAIVESLDWDSFALLYENEDSIIKMQEVLKLQQHSAEITKNTVILKKIGTNGDCRHILKGIRSMGMNHVVLDCSAAKILDIMRQAKEIKLLEDVNFHIFITSLDAHTIDYSTLEARSNITTLRMFDPRSSLVIEQANKYFPGVQPQKITIKMALQHDALLLVAESLNSIKADGGAIISSTKSCNSSRRPEENINDLEAALQEATVTGITGEVNVDVNGKREVFDLSVIEIEKPDKPIGLWNSNEPEKVVRTRNATEREAELLERLSRHNFIVTSKIGPPYLYEYDDREKQLVGNNRYYGYSMDLMGEIAKQLNISFHFNITQGSSYADLQKDLIERRADLAICDFTVTPQRQEVIDFSLPFMTLGIGILHKKEQVADESHLYAFMDPFSKVVWFYIGALYLFISLSLVVIARLSKEDWENPHPCDQNPTELENIWTFKNCCWLTLGSITTQGCDILPKGKYTRIATGGWWLFSLIIPNSYIANLAAFLTSSQNVKTIDDVEELSKQSKVKYGCYRNGATASFFEHSNNTLYQRMWNTMTNEKPSVFEESNADGVERVNSTKNGLYAFFMESTSIDYELSRRCNLRRIGDLLDSKTYAIGMPLNAAYRNSINGALLNLSETGKLAELREKWWVKEREGVSCPSTAPVDSLALSLDNVGGVFIVLIAGIGIAFFVAIVEFLWNVYNISMEEQISYFDALKAELKFACNIFVTRKRPKPVLSESSSSNSGEENVSRKGILVGAGAALSVNATILNRMASCPKSEGQSPVKSKSSSKQGST